MTAALSPEARGRLLWRANAVVVVDRNAPLPDDYEALSPVRQSDLQAALAYIEALESLIPTIEPAAWEVGSSDGKPPAVVSFSTTLERSRLWAVHLAGLPEEPPPGFGRTPAGGGG